jgi:hypothetical protein
MKKVLALWAGNIYGRQKSEGYLRHFAKSKVEIYSVEVLRYRV